MYPAQLAKRALVVLLLAFAGVYHLDLNLNRDSPSADAKKGFRKECERGRERGREREREREGQKKERKREREKERERERARDPTHHTLLLVKVWGRDVAKSTAP